MTDAGGTGDLKETLENWSHSPQASRQHYTISVNLEPRGEKEKRTTEKYVTADVKETGYNWRDWL